MALTWIILHPRPAEFWALSKQLNALVVPRKGVKSGKGQRKANKANRWR